MSHSDGLDRPKLLHSPSARAQRRSLLHEAHVAPLTKFVASLRLAAGAQAQIPEFDPWDGGVGAEVLFLLEAPGPKAIESGFISRNNPDESAKNFWELNYDAGISRRRTVTWNVVPWYIGDGERVRAATETDIVAGVQPLPALLRLLPRLRVVVFLGQKAALAEIVVAETSPHLRRFKSPHPSPRVVNRAPGNRGRILSVLREVAEFIGPKEPAV